MEHYFGARSIMGRIGYRDHRRLPWIIRQTALPVYRRPDPKHTFRWVYYASESMIQLWETARAKCCYEELKAKEDEPKKTQ